MLRRTLIAATLGLLGGLSGPAVAGNGPCGQYHSLLYVGRMADDSASIWISAFGNPRWSVTSTDFRGPANQSLETFDQHKNTLRLLSSPIVQTGAAGQHSLYDIGDGNCMMDSKLQSGGLVIGGGGGGGGGGGSGGGYGGGDGPLDRVVSNVNQAFLTTYQNRAFSITERIVAGVDVVAPADATWQAWTEARRTGLNDERHGQDGTGKADDLLLGAHRRFGSDLVAGVAVAVDRTEFDAYGRSLRNDSRGVQGGPYLGYRFSPTWVGDAWLAYGTQDVDSRLDVLKGRYDTWTWLFSANLTGRYIYGDYLLRPKASFYASRSRTDAFDYRGVIPGMSQSLTLRIDDDVFSYVTSELSAEISRPLPVGRDGGLLVPSLRLGLRYDLHRPNDGKTYDALFDEVDNRPWSGSVRAGVAFLPEKRVRFELLGGYYSLGRRDLDLWDLRFNATLAF